MARQTKPLVRQCDDVRPGRGGRGACERAATHGIYAWADGETRVDLDHPVACVCGAHKPRFHTGQQVRIVRLWRG
jgi:hypothetical protein